MVPAITPRIAAGADHLMSTQVWPAAGVPAKALAGSYQEQLKSFAAEFTPDVGPPSRWPRSSKAMLEVSFRIFLTAAQRQNLLTFYVNTCRSGSLPFTLDDPMTAVNYMWFWMEAPAINLQGAKTHFNAEIRIRRFV
jgi:hypothetical protein